MGKGGLGGGLIQSVANQGVFNASPYVNSNLANSFTPPPTNPYAPRGMGYLEPEVISNTKYARQTPQYDFAMGGNFTVPPAVGAINPNANAGGSGFAALLNGNSGGSGGGSGGSGGGYGGSGGPFPLEGKYGIVKMAEGGLSSAAQHMASKGRNGDSMLVHMTPGEVKGLQALAMAHGGSLSINPTTGLPEASFLKRILPMVAGAALTPFIGPYGAALAVGGFETARTGDVGKGFMSGLGALGGANIATGLSAAAPGATTSVAPSAATTTAGEGARNIAADTIRTNVGAGVQGGMTSFPGAENVASNFQTTAPTTFSNMGAGIKNINATPGGFTDFLGSNKMNLAMSAAPAVADAMTPKINTPGLPEEDPRYKGSPYNYRLSSDFSGYTPQRPSPFYTPVGLGYAEGGPILDNMPTGGLAAIQGMRDGYGARQTTDGNIPQFADGGSLGGYSDGGRMLKGPGDGMSDSIPATIGKRQPARLADGEFVVPADVVSHLGNGSTDAGARKLYSMMDKVRKARTGKKKQAPAVKAEKYMPKA